MAQPDTIPSDVAQGEASVLMFLLAGGEFAVELNRVQHILWLNEAKLLTSDEPITLLA